MAEFFSLRFFASLRLFVLLLLSTAEMRQVPLSFAKCGRVLSFALRAFGALLLCVSLRYYFIVPQRCAEIPLSCAEYGRVLSFA
jgi:hypothetical protein